MNVVSGRASQGLLCRGGEDAEKHGLALPEHRSKSLSSEKSSIAQQGNCS